MVDVAMKEEFESVIFRDPRTGHIVIKLPNTSPKDIVKITTPSTVQVRVPVVGQDNDFEVIYSSLNRRKDFQPGHVFKAEELPENKKHLAGGLYFEDNADGTMHIVSAEQFDGMATWHTLGEKIDAINKEGHNNVRKGIKEGWDSLLASEFVDKAGLDMSGSTPGGHYWESDKENLDLTSWAMVRYPNDSGRGWIDKDGVSHGRFFSDEPKFQLI